MGVRVTLDEISLLVSYTCAETMDSFSVYLTRLAVERALLCKSCVELMSRTIGALS
jgi:hypothetical protein